MKKMVAILLFVAFSIPGQAYARTEAEVKKDLLKAAKTAVTIYKQNGMAGLIEKTQSCYNNKKTNGFYCVYFDLASRHIDQLMIDDAAQQGMTFPKNEFFDDELFGGRISGVFKKANMDIDTSNEYLQSVTPVINKMVEDNMLRKK